MPGYLRSGSLSFQWQREMKEKSGEQFEVIRSDAQEDSAHGRVLGFTMTMLQRRFASSVYAVRRSLERMRGRREEILDDPEKYRRQRMEARLPDDFDELEGTSGRR